MNSVFTFKTFVNCSRLIVRHYAFKSELKIKWVRPEKISCILPEKSGDLKPMSAIDSKQFLPGFEASQELADASNETKNLFTLDSNPRIYTTSTYRDNLIKEVQRHGQDYGSMEAKLARMTGLIRGMQDEMQQRPRNQRRKVILKELIEKRKKFLKYLRRWDYKRFEWVLEKLDLVYKSPPTEFHWITRKESLRKLAIIHCENIKAERLNAYRKILENQQVEFLEKKLKNFEFIRKEQIECKVPVTVSEADIRNVRKQLDKVNAKRNALEETNNS